MEVVKKILIIFAVSVFTGSTLVSQDSESSMFFSNKILSNPAFTGSSGRSEVELSYRDYYPGYGLQVGSVYASFDSFFERLHGGLGIYLFENKLGNILNDLRGGITYAYHLRAGRDIYINAGFMATVIHRSFNIDNVILPDQIDPLLGPVLASQEVIDLRSGTFFDTGVGFLVNYRNITSGFTLNHIASPSITGRVGDGARLPRRLSLHGSANFELPVDNLETEPIAAVSLQGDMVTGFLGLIIGYKAISINAIPHFDSRMGFSSVQCGIYFESGDFGLGYMHYFSAGNAGISLPITYSSQISIRVGLKNVEKRDVIRAINYPKL